VGRLKGNNKDAKKKGQPAVPGGKKHQIGRKKDIGDEGGSYPDGTTERRQRKEGEIDIDVGSNNFSGQKSSYGQIPKKGGTKKKEMNGTPWEKDSDFKECLKSLYKTPKLFRGPPGKRKLNGQVDKLHSLGGGAHILTREIRFRTEKESRPGPASMV